MKATLTSFGAGILFGLGLCISEMTNPGKVLAFLDFGGAWDPSLAFVMAAAVGINIVLFRVILRRARPVVADRFHLPTQTAIDARLIGGSALFGLGWGLAGFCPGAAVAAVAIGVPHALAFCGAMLGGMLLFHVVFERRGEATPLADPALAAAE